MWNCKTHTVNTSWNCLSLFAIRVTHVQGVLQRLPLWSNPNDVLPFLNPTSPAPRACPSIVNAKQLGKETAVCVHATLSMLSGTLNSSCMLICIACMCVHRYFFPRVIEVVTFGVVSDQTNVLCERFITVWGLLPWFLEF